MKIAIIKFNLFYVSSNLRTGIGLIFKKIKSKQVIQLNQKGFN